MYLDQGDASPTDSRQTRWKKRLQSIQSSFRGSFRSKSGYSTKDARAEEQETDKTDGKKPRKKSNLSRVVEDNASVLWRETDSTERKQSRLSEMQQKQDHYKPMSTTKAHSMHGKTFTADSRDHKWRKYHSNNSLSDIQRSSCRNDKINNHLELNREENYTESSKRDHSAKKSKSTLFRPKSLNRLSSLFKHSSGARTDSITHRGNIGESSHLEGRQPSSKEHLTTNCNSSTSFSTSVDSLDEILDTDGSYLHVKRYYSLKRSRASLIFPPTSERSQKAGKLREKSSTFCGAKEPVTLEAIEGNGAGVNELSPIWKRRGTLAIRKKRTISLLVPLPSSSQELTQPGVVTNKSLQSLIGTNYSHLRSQYGSITNIRCISRHLSMSKFTNVPSLGVTYIDNDGLEKTFVILSGKATQSCYELFKNNERVPLPIKFHSGKSGELINMGNNTGTLERSASYGDILDRGGTLKPSSSTPDLFARRTSYTLSRDNDKKKKMSSMIKGLSLKRHTLAVNAKEHDSKKKEKKNRKRFGFGTHHEKHIEKQCGNSHLAVRLADCNNLSRSLDCLTDVKTKRIPPIHRDTNDLFSYRDGSKQMNQYETIQPKNSTTTELDNFLSESEGDDSSITSNDSSLDNSEYKTILIRRGSQPNVKVNHTFTDELPNSLPSNIENNRGYINSHRRVSPLYNSTPIARMSTLERERSKSAVSEDPEVPPPVRPRIQSLEELSPVTAEVILRKKKSLASRKTRQKHSISVPSEEQLITDNTDSKRYSLGSEMSDFIGSPVSLTAFKSFSTDHVDSQESLTTSDVGSSTSIGSSDKLLTPPHMYMSPLRASMEDISKSPTILEECEKTESERMSLSEGNKRTSLSRNQRLGRSTGDLSFEPGTSLKRKSALDEIDGPFEDMDVPEAFAEALWDHVTMDPEELSFKAGDIITVISMTNIDWWFGQVGEMVGWFPAPFVRVRVSQTLDELENHLAPPVRTRRFTNEGILTKDVVRARVVNEILETEKSYVKNLKDVVEGYLRQAQKRNEMFSEERIYLLFSNIEEIYTFHQKLLAQMKKCYVKGDPCASQIGAVFLDNKQGFNIYSEYCNNHPQAIAEFKILIEKAKYKHFFEACRLLQDMINISLNGFLLTPVQKICKYPLQLAELLKHTHNTHKDYEPVRQALESMKNVAALINERKRKVENISKIAKWQSTIEGWEGENVLERSSELIHSGEVSKVVNGTTQERVCFLFDHQLIYCKKDILRKNGLTYKGRIDMDLAEVEWLEDGVEMHKNEPLNNAWRIYNAADSKWYVVCTKKPDDKEKWQDAFEKEKMKANEEAQSGLAISQSTRRAVMRSASSSLKGRKAAEKREKFLGRSSSQTDFLKSPPSPVLRLPPAVSSADFIKEEDAAGKDSVQGFLQRTSALRRSLGLRGSKRNHKDKRTSSVF